MRGEDRHFVTVVTDKFAQPALVVLDPVMAFLMVTAVMIIIFNLIADIAYGLLDPRVRYD